MKKYFEKIYKDSKNTFFSIVENNLINNIKMFIVTANPETLIISEKNSNFKKALLDEKTLIIPDGIGVLKGLKFFKYNAKETIPGIELSTKLLELCNTYKKRIFLFGSTKNVIETLVNVINLKYKNLEICGYENGYVENKQEIFNRIQNLKPDVILVALGIPEQELLIYNNLNKFKKGIFVGVGGSFDVLSGIKNRAPKQFRKLHLEWLYRIFKEPKRLKRFFNNNLKYSFKLLNLNKKNLEKN